MWGKGEGVDKEEGHQSHHHQVLRVAKELAEDPLLGRGTGTLILSRQSYNMPNKTT